MASPSRVKDQAEEIEEPWSMREPVIRRLVAAGLKLPTVSGPLDFPEPEEPEQDGPTLTEQLISDRRSSR